jgi:hypothetical protein
VTRPSTPEGAGQGAKAPAADPPPAGWAQGGAQGRSVEAADGQGGGQAFGPGHGGGQDWLGGTGWAVVVAGAGSAEAQGGGQDGPVSLALAQGGAQAVIARLELVLPMLVLPMPPSGSVG